MHRIAHAVSHVAVKVATSEQLGCFCWGLGTPIVIGLHAITAPKSLLHSPSEVWGHMRSTFSCGYTHGVSYCLGLVAGVGLPVTAAWHSRHAQMARGF